MVRKAVRVIRASLAGRAPDERGRVAKGPRSKVVRMCVGSQEGR